MSGRGEPVPVTVLGGSDRRPGKLPDERSDLHPLGTYKGLAIRVAGRPLIAHLVERLRAARRVGPIAVAGPARAYGTLGLDVELVDTDGSVADNLRAALAHHASVRGADAPLAFLACDVLPTAGELDELLAERERDAGGAPPALWLPMVRVPRDDSALGAFAWKPRYAIAPAPGDEPAPILPGHLAVCVPATLRLPLLLRLLDAAYRSRNRSLGVRRATMLRLVTGSLLLRDLIGLARLRAPILTAGVLANGLRLARSLRAGTLTTQELEELVERILVRRSIAGAARRVRLPHCDAISLAEDIDTAEEARAVGGSLAADGAEAASDANDGRPLG